LTSGFTIWARAPIRLPPSERVAAGGQVAKPHLVIDAYTQRESMVDGLCLDCRGFDRKLGLPIDSGQCASVLPYWSRRLCCRSPDRWRCSTSTRTMITITQIITTDRPRTGMAPSRTITKRSSRSHRQRLKAAIRAPTRCPLSSRTWLLMQITRIRRSRSRHCRSSCS
jgi:hypothetical protein